ncbi:D-alanyl-D-alanine carboxypeptidase/D-alanyl-D-alanine-endopeptidase (penicillin-binding protein 4) [Gillisia sp. Hel_I_86]|uniref:D-alanyl-D-alanine carboxypeptidase/D-alanyl-D-alanine-endopeptidase n=1 Tax=Gillisia sp. Hel_I_86 TaxID=1249981 RepID=UPI00119BC5D2|nr:D-alanyl-D-alanine carboxypeptidase [Gillisia sp. Hel_I_86]TVZ25709.1 D-alanyl-D-alanine carboxypeptidase/D-alanyl-D-alanine-endopeptidase (penicillin-binding protein 4) [Gillisia sp. Hel_I_86]
MRSKILHSLSLFLIILLLASCSSTRKLRKELSQHLTSEVFDQSFTGFSLYDLEKRKFIIEQNSNKYFTPASNIKLFTFYAGLKVLGDSIPGIRYYSTEDSLVFWSTGDPSFLNPKFSNSKVFDFLKSTSKELYFATSATTNPPLGSGWAWDDYNDAYSAERSQFPVYGNLVNFKWNSKDTLPVSFPSYFSDSLVKDQELSNTIRRDVDANTFRYHFSNEEEIEFNIPFKTSPELTVKLLSDTLKKRVTLTSKQSRLQNRNIQTIYSVAADSLYKEMLVESDNFIAEQLLLLISEKINDNLNTKSIIEYLQSTYFKDLTDEIKWVDGSGLSRYNLITPHSLVNILERILEEVPKVKLFRLLPVNGKTGTLKNWDALEEPYIYAKSGSLRNNYSLSGYLKTKSGKLMIFSFMNNNYVVPSSEIKKEMEKILLEIRNIVYP